MCVKDLEGLQQSTLNYGNVHSSTLEAEQTMIPWGSAIAKWNKIHVFIAPFQQRFKGVL